MQTHSSSMTHSFALEFVFQWLLVSASQRWDALPPACSLLATRTRNGMVLTFEESCVAIASQGSHYKSGQSSQRVMTEILRGQVDWLPENFNSKGKKLTDLPRIGSQLPWWCLFWSLVNRSLNRTGLWSNIVWTAILCGSWLGSYGLPTGNLLQILNRRQNKGEHESVNSAGSDR